MPYAHWLCPRAASAAAAGRRASGIFRSKAAPGLFPHAFMASARARGRPSCSSTAAAGLPAILRPMTGRRAISRSRPARSWCPSTTAARPRCGFPARSRTPLRPTRTCSPALRNLAAIEALVGVAGDSAGGNLAATTAIACRDAGIKLAAQLLVYPVTDVVGNLRGPLTENARFPSRSGECGRLFSSSRATMEWFCGHCLADPTHGTDWRVSPLRRPKTLPGSRLLIVATAWFDSLRDEGKPYAEALEAAGVPTSLARRPRPDPRLFRPR